MLGWMLRNNRSYVVVSWSLGLLLMSSGAWAQWDDSLHILDDKRLKSPLLNERNGVSQKPGILEERGFDDELPEIQRCAAGEYHDSGECRPCAEGSYSPLPGAWACIPWTSCRPGEIVEVPGSATDDRVCALCPTGMHSIEHNAVECVDWSIECVPGEYARNRRGHRP